MPAPPVTEASPQEQVPPGAQPAPWRARAEDFSSCTEDTKGTCQARAVPSLLRLCIDTATYAGPEPSEFFFMDVSCHFAQGKDATKTPGQSHPKSSFGCVLPFCADATKTPGQIYPNASFWMWLAILRSGSYENAAPEPKRRARAIRSLLFGCALPFRTERMLRKRRATGFLSDLVGRGPRRLCAGRVLRSEVCITVKQLSNTALLPCYLSSST